MTTQLHAPSLPVQPVGDFSALGRLTGHVAAAAFVAFIAFVGFQIVTFQATADADCLPDICGPAANP